MPVDEFEVGEDRVPVSERSFDDPELPELSLATNMSVDSEYIDSVAPDELELSHESLGAEADASCQVHQENGSPDWA
jgi:hypothetical protein